ncbi:dehydrogenase/reductase SDR family member 7 [Tetranychus urticae]|uniref:Dehydrogenase/reductase SDR family member 7 n=1 Tax=Tetranychus urticae TaxID=32264 RepID=T1KCA9_TETUR|nr:dehydrogenase/reductase SDR family member 7 [Tetranychus urticae]
MFLMLIVFALAAFGFYWLYRNVLSKFDCDFCMKLYEKYGKQPSETLKGKRVWITGAASGIGEALAYEMASCKCKLALSDLNNQGLERVKRKIVNHHGLQDKDVLLVPFNLTETAKHEEAYKKIMAHFKQIDIFFCNAGRSQRAKFEDIDIQVHRELFEINVFSGINLSRLLVQNWIEEKHPGHIVVTSSVAGKFGLPQSASYTASKYALLGYYDCLRNEVKSKGIQVTVVCPGPTATAILTKSFTGKPGEVYGKEFGEVESRIPADRQAKMFAIAAANGVAEAWTSRPPYLWLVYAAQYAPSLFKICFPIFCNEEILKKMRDGH